ncbi:MAG: hypothetical protein ACLTXR_07565 [Clostridia bacterium]
MNKNFNRCNCEYLEEVAKKNWEKVEIAIANWVRVLNLGARRFLREIKRKVKYQEDAKALCNIDPSNTRAAITNVRKGQQ